MVDKTRKNEMAKCRRIEKKINENNHVPTEEEVALLEKYDRPIVEELKQTQMAAYEASENGPFDEVSELPEDYKRPEITTRAEQREVDFFQDIADDEAAPVTDEEMDEALEEEYQECKATGNLESYYELKAELEEEKAEEESTRPAIVVDGDVTEIAGKVTDMVMGDNYKGAEIMVEDIDGNNHQIKVTNKGNVWGIFYQIDCTTYAQGLDEFAVLDTAGKRDEMTRLINKNKVMVFRTRQIEGETVLFAPVSLKYQKAKIEDLIPEVEKMFAEQGFDGTMEITPSTGIWGGKATLKVTGDAVADYGLSIDGGILDGGHAVKIQGRGLILYCSNQLTIEVSKLVADKLPKFAFGGKMAHVGKENTFLEKVKDAVGDVLTFQSILEEAKEIKLDQDSMVKIIDFYVHKNKISEKTKATILENLQDDDIQQVPWTLWGLAMAVTWAGTHGNVRDGVKNHLQVIGGELLCVSQNWEAYQELIKTEEQKYAEKEAEKATA